MFNTIVKRPIVILISVVLSVVSSVISDSEIFVEVVFMFFVFNINFLKQSNGDFPLFFTL